MSFYGHQLTPVRPSNKKKEETETANLVNRTTSY